MKEAQLSPYDQGRQIVAVLVFISGFIAFLTGNDGMAALLGIGSMFIFLGFIGSVRAIGEMVVGILKTVFR